MTIHEDTNGGTSENNIIEEEDTSPTFDPQVQLELNDEHIEQVQTENGGQEGNSRPKSLRKRFMGRFRKRSLTIQFFP